MAPLKEGKKIISFNPADFEQVRKIALTYPGVVDAVSHNDTPSLKVEKKFMSRLHESGEFIPIHLDFELREKYLEEYPDIFHLPQHYVNYPYICMWVNKVNTKLLKEIIELSWRGLAGKKLLQQWDSLHK
jgi:hypothetical protein